MLDFFDPINNWNIGELIKLMADGAKQVYDAFGNVVAVFHTPLIKWIDSEFWRAVITEASELGGGIIAQIVSAITGEQFHFYDVTLWEMITVGITMTIVLMFIQWILDFIN